MTLAGAETPRLLIADDEAPARARLRDLLDECREAFPLVIVDEARNGREVLEVQHDLGSSVVGHRMRHSARAIHQGR